MDGNKRRTSGGRQTTHDKGMPTHSDKFKEDIVDPNIDNETVFVIKLSAGERFLNSKRESIYRLPDSD